MLKHLISQKKDTVLASAMYGQGVDVIYHAAGELVTVYSQKRKTVRKKVKMFG